MGTLIDGIAANEQVDSSGEILKIEGCDISTLAKDGVINFEHENTDPEDVVGKILYAKKIFSEHDCDNDRQLFFYKQTNVPYIYIIGELLDTEGHPGALAVAAMYRYSKKNNEPMMIGFSVEGSTLDRSGMYLTHTLARRVAATLRPCNKSCLSSILDEIPDAKKAMGKDGFRPLHKAVESEFSLFEGEVPNTFTDALADLITFSVMAKTLTAGSPTAAPGQNVDGAALQKEDQVSLAAGATITKMDTDTKFRLLEKIRDKWDRRSPLHEFIKAEMPELGEKFKDHFSELMQDVKLVKANLGSDIVSHRHTIAHVPHDKIQRLLVAGIKSNKIEDSSPHKVMNSSGQRVIIRRGHNSENDKLFSSEKAVAFHNLARDVFGLGDHVPSTAAYINPHDRHIHHAVASLSKVISGIHPKYAKHYDDAVQDMAGSGLLHKLAIMDYVLGHSNRHLNNLVIDPTQNKPYLVSNEKTFDKPNLPDYWSLVSSSNKIVDHGTRDWLQDIDEKKLATNMRHNGMPKKHTEEAVARLQKAKKIIGSQPSILEMYHEDEDEKTL